MFEDLSIKAIMIGAGILISIATISMVLTYYNLAKETANSVAKTATNIEGNYRRDIEDSLVKNELKGNELKNLIMYFYKNPGVNINVKKLKLVSENPENLDNINNDEANYLRIIENIRANLNFTLSQKEERNILILNIEALN